MILEKAAPGDIYNVGASNEMSNLKFLQSAMSVLDELSPRDDGQDAQRGEVGSRDLEESPRERYSPGGGEVASRGRSNLPGTDGSETRA